MFLTSLIPPDKALNLRSAQMELLQPLLCDEAASEALAKEHRPHVSLESTPPGLAPPAGLDDPGGAMGLQSQREGDKVC